MRSLSLLITEIEAKYFSVRFYFQFSHIHPNRYPPLTAAETTAPSITMSKRGLYQASMWV